MNFSSVSVGSTQDNLGDVVLPSFDLWAYVGSSWVHQATISNPASSSNDASPYDSGPHAFYTFTGLSVTADQLRITATPGVPGSWMFVDEVTFNATPVPEPTTWAMLLAGLGLVAGARRRSRR
ncbi:PEPxxWA-CTERM sorting domain-containing protein [Pseudoduganella sp. FT55W]|uniref:PEPxxWA-CTERM sorting domain-containing protein n=2 Tax=Duganella rivi TaxID=2666083 RepID=A0A7X4KB52_9BURK|nr:PEPxxWA-CTERM sorting domain-containing protein [Duganella rivi]